MLQRQDAQRIDMLGRQGSFEADMLRRKGDLYVQQQEQDRVASLYGLAADRQTATSQALNTAQAQLSSAFGNLGSSIIGGVASGGFGGGSPSTSNLEFASGSGPSTNVMTSNITYPTSPASGQFDYGNTYNFTG
jgi:hypothetical protein